MPDPNAPAHTQRSVKDFSLHRRRVSWLLRLGSGTVMDIDERNVARLARARISLGECWPVPVIAVGLIATTIWVGILGWGLVEILALVF